MNKGLFGASILISVIALSVSIYDLRQPRGADPQRLAVVKPDTPDLKAIVGRIDKQQKTIDRLDQFYFREMMKSRDSAFVDVASKSYTKVDCDGGFFFLKCEDVQPYLDGQKLTLGVGNPLSVTLNGLKLKVEWGISAPHSAEGVGDWFKQLRTTDISSTQTLEPGRWNNVEVVLPATTPAQLGWLKIGVETNLMTLQP